MSSGNKNVMPINWQEVPNKELGLDEANPEDIAMAKLQEKFQHKQVQEAEAKKCREAKEAEKRVCEAEEAEKRVHEAEAQHWEVAAIERQREAEQQREAERQEAERAKEAKKQQRAKSEAGPSSMKRKMACDQCSCNKEKCEWPVTEIRSTCVTTSPQGGKKKKRTRRARPIFNNDDNIVMTSAHKAGKSESRAWETMAQVVDRRMGKVVKELQGLRKGVTAMAESNQDLAWVLYHRFQSMDTLVDKVQIFGAEGFLSKPAPESKPAKDELQETEGGQGVMRKEWMWQEEATLTKHLKGKGKKLAREEEQEGDEQEGDEQGTRDEQGEGEAK
ncbi:hypothetical protein ID866_10601 [Astraeus odoratus]|nr:hypothetical protein ID866_10601 [Astraeus odoratus]